MDGPEGKERIVKCFWKMKNYEGKIHSNFGYRIEASQVKCGMISPIEASVP